ncbi:MAG: hotdog fold thioesterase [Lacibacter sp.]|jgi:1,4-dihydroxy-2-naphthoyl-CoA hydrolase|nr:hotdog fold thioesterase [Lacibacter sp.]
MSVIWFKKELSVEELSALGKRTIAEILDIKFIETGKDFIKATMPVDHRTHQPHGLLHGGASCVLAETLGSIASAHVIDQEKFSCVGIEINANHIRSVRSGLVTGIVTPIHIGASTHVWDIKIYDEREKLVCVSRLTVAILKKTK